MNSVTQQLNENLIRHRANVLGRDRTTYCIGGPLHHLIEPNSPAEVRTVLQRLHAIGLTPLVLGAGSNLLIADLGLTQPIIHLAKGLRFCNYLAEGLFEVGGASALMTVSRDLSEAGYSGLEFAGGIPASVGGAVRMNAGAHGSDMSAVIEHVNCVSNCGDEVVLNAKELRYGYRASALPQGWVVVSCVIKLVAGDRDAPRTRRAHFLAERKSRQPLTTPSCGSVFKNPRPDQPAGKLIEEVGLRGQAIGGAEISRMHGNWIVNPKRNATAADVQALIALAQERVRERFGIELTPEVLYWEDRAGARA